MGFFSKVKLKSSEIVEQAVNYISKRYDQDGSTFSVSSPFGQLLAVISNICELIFTYISHTAEELNIQTAQNHESIFGLSRLTGHDPFRGSSAYGKLTLKLNASAPSLLNGNETLIINNFTRLKITETGETYFLNMPSDYVKLSTQSNDPIEVLIIQGEIESQVYTSDGTALQTFNPIVKTMTDHYNVSVTVNGKEWTRVESLYDMPADNDDEGGECFMVKSSINVGLTIIFGNGDFGKIPPSGAEIIVTYIKTSGSSGNVYSSDMKVVFMDEGYDETGVEVNLNDVLEIITDGTNDDGEPYLVVPTLGADYEDPDFTKLIAPRVSKSYVLATAENFETFLARYNQFSFIRAYNSKDYDNTYSYDNITYLKVLPNIKTKIGNGQDYFTLCEDTSNFNLTDEDKNSLYSAITNSGRQLIGTEVVPVDTSIQKFVINVIIRYFENASKHSIRTDIRSLLSKYFLNINRNDIIPVSDLIALIETIEGVDTCDVFFILEKNETAKINGYYTKKATVYNQYKWTQEDTTVYVDNSSDPRVGFDSFGNIIVEDNEIYIPAGGFTDSDGHVYSNKIETGKLGPLNIFFLSAVEYSAYNQTMQQKLTYLLNS